MVLASAFPSSTSNIKLAVCIAIYSISSLKFCCSAFLSRKLEICGIFLQDFQPYTREQGDFIHEALEVFQFNQTKRPTTFIIKNKLSHKKIHLSIFRSMNYDCFFFVHINFGKDLFSTIPSFKEPLQSALYQKALFLLFVTSNPHNMLTSGNRYLQHERQYRIFVFRIKIPFLISFLYRAIPFVFLRTYFFCSFCTYGLVLLNALKTTNILSSKLLSFEKHWKPTYVQHYFHTRNGQD